MNSQRLNTGRAALAAPILTLLAACGSGGSAAPQSAQGPLPLPAAPQVPPPSTGNHKVTGEVLDFATGMIASADVNLWVGLPSGGGYSYWWAHGPLRSDALGLFEATRLPESSISILAFKDGYVQPCVVRARVDRDLPVRVELIRKSALQHQNGPQRPQLAVEPWLTGMIFETTAAGRQPVNGVDLWVETGPGLGLANTQSEADGQYFLCNLEANVMIHLSKPGFRSKWVGPIDASFSRTLEIEIERL